MATRAGLKVSLAGSWGPRTQSLQRTLARQLPLQRRLNSSSSNAQTHQQASEPFQRPGRPRGPPSRHGLFYREIYPPLFRCLAYGSGIYFALHLLWQYLDGEEQAFLEEEHKTQLEHRVKELRQSAASAGQKVASSAKASLNLDDDHSSSQNTSKRPWWRVWG